MGVGFGVGLGVGARVGWTEGVTTEVTVGADEARRTVAAVVGVSEGTGFVDGMAAFALVGGADEVPWVALPIDEADTATAVASHSAPAALQRPRLGSGFGVIEPRTRRLSMSATNSKRSEVSPTVTVQIGIAIAPTRIARPVDNRPRYRSIDCKVRFATCTDFPLADQVERSDVGVRRRRSTHSVLGRSRGHHPIGPVRALDPGVVPWATCADSAGAVGHERGLKMTHLQAPRESAARFAKLAIGRFVVAARLGNGIDGRTVRQG